MNCVSSKSTDKKAKKGKSSPFKTKAKKDLNVEVKEMKNGETVDAVNEIETLDIGATAKVTADHVDEPINNFEDADALEKGESSKETAITEEIVDKDNKTEENSPLEHNQEIKMEEDVKQELQEPKENEREGTEATDSDENTEKCENKDDVKDVEESSNTVTIELKTTEEDNESEFVVIETPGETNDDRSDSISVTRIIEPFTKLVDSHAISLVLKNHNELFESDMDVTSELLLQYLTKEPKKHLKSTVRKAGWSSSDEIRKILWTKICQHLYKADTDDVFVEYDETLFSDNSHEDMRVPSFVDTQHMSQYYLNKDGIIAARKVMGVLEMTNPDIVYSPMLYPVVCLFLHFMDVAQCYNCIYALLRNPAFLSQTKVCFEASKFVIRDLVKKHAKSAYTFLVRNSTSVDAVLDSWIWWILQDLPFQYLIRVFDCYLIEGVKVLYRATLSILIHFTKSQGKKASFPKADGSCNSALISSLRQYCQEIPVPIDKFLKTGFSIRGLKKKDIKKLQVKHEMYVTSQRHLINNADTTNHLPMSRSFSGLIVLQNMSSHVLTADMLLAIWTWLPTRYAVCQPELLYTSEEHGTSLVTLYQRVENHQPTIIVIKTTTDEIFGAYCSTYWKERRTQSSNHLSYFGTGETFIFTLLPEKKRYPWVGLSGESIPNTANMFQAGDRSILTIGGGHGEAIYLDENLIHCRSEKCDTFNNEPLSQNEDFMCRVVEVYGFQ